MNKLGSITTAIVIVLLPLWGSFTFAQSTESQTFLSNLDEKNVETEEQEKNERSPKKEEPQKKEEKPLDFSDTGRPGQQTAGESRGNCVNLDSRLEALVPSSHAGKTISGHPSFWVYLPFSDKQIYRVEFILQNEAREDVWRSQLKANKDVGYKKFSLPKTASPLKVGEWYRWYVKVYCQSHTASTQYVQSWIQRIPLTSQLHLELQQQSQLAHKTFGHHGVWYDTVDSLIQEFQREPNDMALERDWQNLIKAKGVELQALPPVGVSYEAVK